MVNLAMISLILIQFPSFHKMSIFVIIIRYFLHQLSISYQYYMFKSKADLISPTWMLSIFNNNLCYMHVYLFLELYPFQDRDVVTYGQ